jgi:hypothetical protein
MIFFHQLYMWELLQRPAIWFLSFKKEKEKKDQLFINKLFLVPYGVQARHLFHKINLVQQTMSLSWLGLFWKKNIDVTILLLLHLHLRFELKSTYHCTSFTTCCSWPMIHFTAYKHTKIWSNKFDPKFHLTSVPYWWHKLS